MNYMCVFLGIVFAMFGIGFAFGKLYERLPAWRKMSDAEKNEIKPKPLCRNVGAMITLNGIVFILKGVCTGFSDSMFMCAAVIWIVIAGADVYYISKSSRYKEQ